MQRLAGQTAVITGGGTGIGQGIALALAREGCRVVIAGRRIDKLREVVKQHQGEVPLEMHECDVADRISVDALFHWAIKTLGRVDILVNNAGINVAKRMLTQLDPADWDRMLAINATGAFNCIRAVVPHMVERKNGLIVNISSVAGKRAGLLGGVGYNASKFAMTALGTSVSLEFGAQGLRVTNVYPGEVDTPILEHRPTPVSAERRSLMLQPEDIAEAVLMVACLPPRAHVAELVIKPTNQDYS
ncbi:MAG: SDR family oxidoreductase [Pirellulales bacterium]|nr:SDR family oxidoreductase [Pirellulales bacterium]